MEKINLHLNNDELLALKNIISFASETLSIEDEPLINKLYETVNDLCELNKYTNFESVWKINILWESVDIFNEIVDWQKTRIDFIFDTDLPKEVSKEMYWQTCYLIKTKDWDKIWCYLHDVERIARKLQPLQ